MSFQRYESRPVTYLAHEITEHDVISLVEPGLYRLRPRYDAIFDFVALLPVKTGDFVMFEDETYIHCPRDSFITHAVVPGENDAEENAAS